MSPEQPPQTDRDDDERARAAGEEDDAAPGPLLPARLRETAASVPPGPFGSDEGTAGWFEMADKLACCFNRRKRNLHPDLSWRLAQVHDDWLQEARLKTFEVVSARWARMEGNELRRYAAGAVWNRLTDLWRQSRRYAKRFHNPRT